ncbi:MAG: hypothetical protein R3C05_14910 [Pirellulaceae bacterium]
MTTPRTIVDGAVTCLARVKLEPLATPGGTHIRYPVYLEHGCINYFVASISIRWGGVWHIRCHPRSCQKLSGTNRAHHYIKQEGRYIAAKKELLECFCPGSDMWRQQVLGVVA